MWVAVFRERRWSRRLTLVAVAFLLGCLQRSAGADESSLEMVPSDTSSPRATLQSFIEACNELHRVTQEDRFFDRTSSTHKPLARRILDCLDLSQFAEYEREEAGSEAAVCIKEILDRVAIPAWEEIPDKKQVEAAAGGPLRRWRIPGTRLTIARVEEGPQRHEYLFTSGTVGRAVQYYRDIASLPYRTSGPAVSQGFYVWYVSAPGHPVAAALVDALPHWATKRVLDQAVWKWLGLSIALLLALLALGACYRLHLRLVRQYRDRALLRYCLTIGLPILAALVPLALRNVAFDYLTLRGTWLSAVSFLSYLATLLASLVVVFALGNRIAAIIIASPQINPEGLDAQFIRIVTRLLSIVAGVIVFLEGGQYLGIPVTTLLASAGVGGLAVALAAQDTVKNLFGTIMLLSDKPFRVGERIVFGKYDGVVEDIGLRSTRIRLLTGHQATIPNDELARTDIENVGRRPHIRRIADIQIPLDTPREKLERAIELVRTALEDHEGLQADLPPRVYFHEFDAAFNIRLVYWYHPPHYWDFLAFSEKLNLAICRAFEQEGIRFSLPTRITSTSPTGEEAPLKMKLVDERKREE